MNSLWRKNSLYGEFVCLILPLDFSSRRVSQLKATECKVEVEVLYIYSSNNLVSYGGNRRGRDRSWIDHYLCNQCLVVSNPAHGDVYCIQHYVIKFISDLRLVSGFLRVLRFAPPTTDKTDRHDITEILLKVALNTII